MAESTLSLTYGDLLRIVSRKMGLGNAVPADPDDLAQVTEVVKGGLRRFYFPQPVGEVVHEWSFFLVEGTVTVGTSGSVALSDDFGGELKELVFDGTTGNNTISIIDIEDLRAMRKNQAANSGSTIRYAALRVVSADPSASAGTRHTLEVFPAPSGDTDLRYTFRRRPVLPISTSTYVWGGVEHAETIKAACLAEMESLEDDIAGPQYANFMERLAASIAFDRQAQGKSKVKPYEVNPTIEASTSLAIDYGYIKVRVGDMMGFGPAPVTWSHEQVRTVERIIEDGLRKFYNPEPLGGEVRDWYFLQSAVNLSLVDDDADYDLPADFGHHRLDPVFVGSASVLQKIRMVSRHEFEYQKQLQGDRTGRPEICTIQGKTFAGGTGQRYEIVFFPEPDTNYTVRVQYRVNPTKISASAPFPRGGETHGNTILEACLASAEIYRGRNETVHQQEYMRCLASSIMMDRKAEAAEYLGQNTDRGDYPGMVVPPVRIIINGGQV